MIDTIEEKKRYLVEKFPTNEDLIDHQARLNLLKLKLILASIKCQYSMNYYGQRDREINRGTISLECPRCSEIESQSHVIQCRATAQFRMKFIIDMHKELKQVQPEAIINEEMRSFINDIKKFLR